MDLTAALEQAFAASDVPGFVAAAARRAGTSFCGAYGVRGGASGVKMTEDTVFQLASLTKAVTSVAAMQLVERGVLALDEPMSALLPELAAPPVIDGFNASGAPVLRASKTPITLRHLLTHTSGLGYEFTSAAIARTRDPQRRPASGSRASITSPLAFEPGTRWLYGVSTDWVGLLVEAATSRSLGAWCAQEIFEPLGMTSTAFTRTTAMNERLAGTHGRNAQGAFAAVPFELGASKDAEFASGGAGLSGTAGDYLRFLRMLLGDGALDGVRILSPASVKAMSTNQVGSLRAGVVDSTVPLLAQRFDLFPGMLTGWGLGFLINPERGPDGRAPGSLAWAGIANCHFWVDSAKGVAGAVFMQVLPFADRAALDLLGALERAVYSAL
jgi:CubicO group peptidase (beta-lactamase class C family)